jgi:hypothetical protein
MDYNQEKAILEFLGYPMARLSDDLMKKIDEHKKLYIDLSLYAKFMLTAFSLTKLLPVGETPQPNAAADIASVASLGRNLIEIYNFFYYLVMDEITKEEAVFRQLVAFYHAEHEMQKVGENMEVSAEELRMHKEKCIEKYKVKIENHPVFKMMQPNIKKKILAGKSATYLTRTEITKKYCSKYNLLNALYRVMSNNVHSGLYSFKTSFSGSTYGCDNEQNRTKIAGMLYLVNYYIGLAAASILMRYPEDTNIFTTYFPNKEVFKTAGDLITTLIMRF